MKLFISWSGGRSKRVAEALRKWLPDLLQSVKPWMSAADLEAGVRWNDRVQRELNETRFGILCLTRENVESPWLLFEAGALAKTLAADDPSHVCPYLVGLDPLDLPQGPLTQFQAKRSDRDGTFSLISAINTSLGEMSVEPDRLARSFEHWWPDLKTELDSLPEVSPAPAPRKAEDMLEEVVALTRSLERQVASDLGAVRRYMNALDRFKLEERFVRIEKTLRNVDGIYDLDDVMTKLDDIESTLERTTE